MVDLPDIRALCKSLGCSTENVFPFLELARMAACNKSFIDLLSINQPEAIRFINIIILNISRTLYYSKSHETAFKVLANMFFFPVGAELMFGLQIFDRQEFKSSNQKGLATVFSNYVIFSCQPLQVQFYQQYLQVTFNLI
jgi:hypothetical protein